MRRYVGQVKERDEDRTKFTRKSQGWSGRIQGSSVALLECLREGGAWFVGSEDAHARIRGPLDGLRLYRCVAAARIGSAELRMDLSNWAVKRFDLRFDRARTPVGRLTIHDAQGRRLLELRRAGRQAVRFAEELDSRFLFAGEQEVLVGDRVAAPVSRPESAVLRDHWDRRVRCSGDLDEMFLWHRIDPPSGLRIGGPTRALHLGADGFHSILELLAKRKAHARMELGLPGARIAIATPLESLLIAAGAVFIPGPEMHVSICSRLADPSWLVRLQGVAGPSLHLELLDPVGGRILRLEEDSCPLLAMTDKRWRQCLESVYDDVLKKESRHAVAAANVPQGRKGY